MTQNEIIRMAEEAGFDIEEGLFPFEAAEDKYIGTERTLELFAAIVAEATGIEQQREIVRLKAIIEEQANGAQNLVLAEREACAKVCEELDLDWRGLESRIDCAAAIRARGE